jgi:preprotein translocase subunit SecY
VPACNQLLSNDSWYAIMLMVITMTAGTGLIMWLGELITERGVGNGMSLLIFVSIAATFPGSLWAIAQSEGFRNLPGRAGIGLIIMGLVVFVEQSQRRVPVQYAKRMVGRRTYGGSTPTSPSR